MSKMRRYRSGVKAMKPVVKGALVQVPIQNNQLVKKGNLLFEIDPSTFQANVNLAGAQFDNMRDMDAGVLDGERVQPMRAMDEASSPGCCHARALAAPCSAICSIDLDGGRSISTAAAAPASARMSRT
jgi:hypothetical protein